MFPDLPTRLAAYKVPRRVFVVDNLPLSMIGKVLRRQVRDQLLARTSGGDGVSEPMEPAHVVLGDGSKVLIRQVHHEDAPLLDEAFARFSLESRRLRFLTDKGRLNEAEMRYFTQVDHHDHEAIGAVTRPGGRRWASRATSVTPRTRRSPRSRWRSSTAGRGSDWAPRW